MPKKTKKREKPVSKPKVKNEETVDNASTPVHNNGELYIDPPVKSDADENIYRVIKLANGLTALLISSASIDYAEINHSFMTTYAKQSADSRGGDDISLSEIDNPGWFKRMMNQKRLISKEAYFELCVNVGSYKDPRQVPGTSSLLSKIILKKSKKYFIEDEDFGTWLWQIDGYEHVQADGEKTVYTFDVQLKYLTEALDRFSHCLIFPILLPKDMIHLRKELLSEYEKSLLDTDKMIKAEKQHLFKNLASSKHCARVYGSNYLKGLSLPNDSKVYKEVIMFRERYYSANRMTIVLKAELPLDTLEKYVKEYFSKIPNNGLPIDECTQYNFMNTFDELKYRRIYKLISYDAPNNSKCEILCKHRIPERIELTWSMPPSQWLYRTKPDRYLAWLIMHEGKGSLISYLRKKKLCERITSGIGDKEFQDNSIYSLFSLSLTLTEEGRKDYKKVLDVVFSYVKFLRREGPQPKIYDEIRQIEESLFRDNYHLSKDDDAKDLSVNMHLYPPVDYLTGKHLYFDYDPVSITTYMNLMSPERANIIIYEKTSKRIQTEFPSDKIPDEWLEHWKNVEPLSDFKLPEPNVFRATDFTLIPVTENTPRKPVKIHSDDQCEIWYGIGAKFRSAMCYINIFYINPLFLTSPENAAMKDMLAKVLKNLMREELYPARAAGMTFKFERRCEEGIDIKINGFRQNLPFPMESIAKFIGDCSKLLTNDLFEVTKKKLLATYEEYILDTAADDTLAEDLRLSILKVVHWTKLDKHTALSSLKFPQFQQFVKQFTDHVYVKCLVQGNMTHEDVIENVQKFIKISKCRPLLPNTRPELRINEIPKGSHYCRVESFVKDSKEVVVKNYYQCGGYSIRTIVMVDLLTSIIEDDVFEELRQVKGIDSIEYSSSFLWHDQRVVGYTIEMSHHCEDFGEINPENLDMDIEVLRRSLHTLFEEMTDKEWFGVMDVFMDQKKFSTGSNELKDEVSKNWDVIKSGKYEFDEEEQKLIALKKLKIDDVRKWMAYLTTTGNNMQKLSIQTTGSESKKSDTTSNYKYRLKYLPVMIPRGLRNKRHHFINDIQAFKNSLKILPIPEKL